MEFLLLLFPGSPLSNLLDTSFTFLITPLPPFVGLACLSILVFAMLLLRPNSKTLSLLCHITEDVHIPNRQLAPLLNSAFRGWRLICLSTLASSSAEHPALTPNVRHYDSLQRRTLRVLGAGKRKALLRWSRWKEPFWCDLMGCDVCMHVCPVVQVHCLVNILSRAAKVLLVASNVVPRYRSGPHCRDLFLEKERRCILSIQNSEEAITK